MRDGCQNRAEAAAGPGACGPPRSTTLYPGGAKQVLPSPIPWGSERTLPSVWGCPLGLECHSSSCPPLFLPPCPRPLTPFKSGEEKSSFLLGPRSILGVVLAEAAAVEYEKS